MRNENGQVHIFFLPGVRPGHMIPMVEMAKVVVSQGVMATIVTNPLNEHSLSKTIATCSKINILNIKFPPGEAGIPAITSLAMIPQFMKAYGLLQEPLEQLLSAYNPDCLVADAFFTWATNSAAKFDIPRLVFHVTGFFSLCAQECIKLYEPHKSVSSDSEPFVIPNLPDEIKMTRMQLPSLAKTNGQSEYLNKLFKAVVEAEESSYGVVVNSFYELEKDYVNHYRKVLGKKAWHIGPLSLWVGNNNEEKSDRGKESSISENDCLKWLDSKEPNCVVYICFGSVANFTESQLIEIAMGLEASGQQFIWVVSKSKNKEEEKEEWLPEGFEKRMEGKGLIIRGWAPQVLILDHEAVGVFVTHCGWNSTLEGAAAGVPMVAWPVSADHFYNEKLITDVLKLGVAVGVQKFVGLEGESIKREAIEIALKRIMVGDEAEKIRSRAKAFAKLARQAVKEGGSSFSDLNTLIEELGARRLKHK
ncbi:Glycosyltransferase [Quillaja saponaria]|uniref:Glycosyltransferase n=1 Tax=Quillaja saponaria TaxID=32244 RepID=A0AAD7P8A1_QUISA|nr:Glycosyltransferase [Quillaja saponaria]